MVNFHTKTSLEVLLENSTEGIILTINEEKNELCCSKSILLPRKFITTG